MIFQLPPLPYEKESLRPFLSEETLEFHYGKHHRIYIERLNQLIEARPEQYASLEEMLQSSEGALSVNAAQVWNHSFYWYGLRPVGAPGQELSVALMKAIERDFSSFEKFKEEFLRSAIDLFGSGWAWLVKDKTSRLRVITTTHGEHPIQRELIPLLVCDVWEHAYYIDYRNSRVKYLEAFFRQVNWSFVAQNLSHHGLADMTAKMKLEPSHQ